VDNFLPSDTRPASTHRMC